MIVLGIETSCDETALALIEAEPGFVRVIASLVHSQAALHSAYGGVFPTLAKREHGKNLVPLLHKLLIEGDVGLPGGVGIAREISPAEFAAALEPFRADVAPQNPELFESFAAAGGARGSAASFLLKAPRVDRIAVTEGPGLEPALWVGLNFARMLSAIWSAPIVPTDHMEGHIVGSLVPSGAPNGGRQALLDAPMPAIAFLLSGGHTELVRVDQIGSYELLGETQDDAVGEAFDKAARLLGFPYPGGPHIAMAAHEAREKGITPPVPLPRPMMRSGDLNLSFSGLKTAVLYATRKAPLDEAGALPDEWKKGLAREFEDAVVETLAAKLRFALEMADGSGWPAGSIIMGGGVAANQTLRDRFKAIAAERGIPIFLPNGYISGDNALMIAVAGSMKDERRAFSAGARGDGGDGFAGGLKARGTRRLSD